MRSCRFWRAPPRVATGVIVSIPSSIAASIDASSVGSLLGTDLAGLAGLAADHLAEVVDALALVGLRLAGRSDRRGDLADQLLVYAHDRQTDGAFDLEADAGGGHDLDRVAVAEVQLQLVPDLDRPISDAGDLERLSVACRNAGHHVGDERSGKAVKLPVMLGLGRTRHDDRGVLLRDEHVRMEIAAQGPLGACHGDGPTVDRHSDAGGDWNGQTTDT